MANNNELEEFEFRARAEAEQAATPKPAAPVAPAKRPETSLGERIQTGLMDPIVGAAQLADRAINPIRQIISPGASSMEDVVQGARRELRGT